MRSTPKINNVCGSKTVPGGIPGENIPGPKTSGGAQRKNPRGGQPTKKPRKKGNKSVVGRVATIANAVVNSQASRAMVGSVKMSSCAAKLAAAIADPFSEEARGSCFPLYPAPDSQKISAFARIEGAIGTQGVGFISFTPSVANDLPSYFVSGSTFALGRNTILTADSTYATGVTPGYHNGPYSASQLVRNNGDPESTLSGRIVAVGARLVYTGTTLNQSGTITCLQHPTHGTLTGCTVSQLQGWAQSDIGPFTRKPCTLVIAPASVHEAAYPTGFEATNSRLCYPFGADNAYHQTYEGNTVWQNFQVVDTVSVGIAAPIAGIMVTGVAGSTFHVDLVQHLEYTGSTAASVSTPNSVDVSSVYAILTAAGQLSTRKMAHPTASNWKLLMDGVRAAMGSPVSLSATGLVRSVARMVL